MPLAKTTASEIGSTLFDAAKGRGMEGLSNALIPLVADELDFCIGKMAVPFTKATFADYVAHHDKVYADLVPDHQLIPEQFMGKGNKLIMVLRHLVTANGEFVDFRVVFLFDIDDDGRITRFEEVYDSALAAPFVAVVEEDLRKGVTAG